MKTYFDTTPFNAFPLEGYINRYNGKKLLFSTHFTGIGAMSVGASINLCWLYAGIDYEQSREIVFLNQGGDPKDAYSKDVNKRRANLRKLIKEYLSNYGRDNYYGDITAIMLSYACTFPHMKDLKIDDNADIGIIVEMDKDKVKKGIEEDLIIWVGTQSSFEEYSYKLQTCVYRSLKEFQLIF